MTTIQAAPPIDNQTLLAAMPGRCHALLAREPALQAHCLQPAHYEAIKSCHSSIASAQAAARLYRDRLCFGERREEGSACFESITYGAFWERVQAFATGLAAQGLARTGQFVGLCAQPSIDWVVADFACLYLGLVSVPLPTTLTQEELGHIVAHVDLACIVCMPQTQAGVAAALAATGKADTPLILAGHHADAVDQSAVSSLSGKWRTMGDVEAAASGLPVCAPVDVQDDEAIRTLLYTSGSAGSPKGAMFPERVWKLHWQGGFFSRQPTDLPYITLAYMPLSHAMGRAQVINGFIRGGLTCFTLRSDMSTLLKDICLVRPTLIAIVPRVAAMIRDCAAMAPAHTDILGDRLLVISTGSALMPPDLLRFLQSRFHAPVLDGYGSTEAGLLTFEGHINHQSVSAFKLLDRPDLGYLTTDRPHPRGELLVKTPYMVSGYFQDEAGTRALFDEEGFLRTGDIVSRHGEDGITVIDRARNVIKLAHGEFVNLARLEDLYAGGALIRQVFLLGAAERPYVMAVVVPDLAACRDALGGAAAPLQEDEPALRDLLLAELHRLARQAGLKGFEVPQAIAVSFEPFTRENGLLTETLKPARGKLRARFEPVLLHLSETVAPLQGVPGDARAQAADLSGDGITQRFAVLLRHALEVPHLPPSWAESAFVYLGGDSMAAMRLSSMCATQLNLALPPGRILDPSLRLRDLVALLSRGHGDVAHARAHRLFTRVHGDGRILRAADLDLGIFLAEDGGEAPRAAGIPRRPDRSGPTNVLLTGANGFFGRALLDCLLDELPAQGRVHCLVRGADEAQACTRLASAMSTDVALAQKVAAAMSEGRIQVLAGDVAHPRFGLSTQAYERLQSQVDHVVHNGALVNHAFGYQTLFEPNVVGTAEVIAFALSGQPRPMCFVSSVGVAGHEPGPEAGQGAEDLGGLAAEWPTHGYAWGYAGTKWAGEILLRQASARHGLPVTVVRPGWLLAHRRYAGQINEGDLLSRLLFGLVRTGVWPPESGEQRPITFAHGVSVDEAAAEVVACMRRMSSGSSAFHGHHVCHLPASSSPHATMGDLARWLRQAGYAGRPAADPYSWHAAFIPALHSLSDTDARHSPLALLEDWDVARGLLWEQEPMAPARLSCAPAQRDPREGTHTHFGLDEALICKSLSDLSRLGLIPPPCPIA